MSFYRIETGNPPARAAVADWLYGLDLVSAEMRELILTAWTTTWLSSPHRTLDDMPYSVLEPNFKLVTHVNEVTRGGLALARQAQAEWGDAVDPEIFVPILILHDVDKPLLYRRSDAGVDYAPAAKALPHGVIGALLLQELGLPDLVVSTVATHAANAPFHGSTLEAYLLHYADFFATDRALMRAGVEPFYQKHWR